MSPLEIFGIVIAIVLLVIFISLIFKINLFEIIFEALGVLADSIADTDFFDWD